ncbi:MAG: translocation/assembly module TamB domain-containing protein [Caulobacterales bacterium]|nr:translocation/assembly module TamB domain-containing protein [Caulobacterales bacterium]
MSGPDDTPAVPAVLKRPALPRAIAAVAIGVLLLVLGLVLTTRYGVLLPQVRLLIEARTDGLKIGRFGRLKIEGLTGDIWRDLRVRRLTVRDEKGVWLEADNLHLSWHYEQLLRRRFQADVIEAQDLKLLRRPTLGPKSKDTGLPVSFHIKRAATRVDLEPAFSGERGLYDIALSLDVARRGGQKGKLAARSLLHPGDHLDLDFAVAKVGPLHLFAQAQEAEGGAIAGALGLSPKQPFALDIRADGTVSEGRFTARATSGALAPLVAQGAWNPQGGQAGGRLLLTASSLTAPYAERFGRDVLFGIGGRKAGEGVYALDARARSDALSLHAWGPGDLGKRALSPQGVRLEAQAASLSRLLGGGPKAGAVQLAGTLTGTSDAWRFAGSGALAELQTADYGLARISGPLELSRAKGGYALKARLAAAGGRGAGYAAAILGGAPTLALDAERLANGQLLLRNLTGVGRGLKLQASGGRSLLGAVTLKGQADISNLAAAGAGANGAASVGWQAAQAKAGAPWTFRLDAHGDRFAVGLAELDRLLGPKPRLQMDAAWDAGKLSVAKASLDGAALAATGAGVLGADGGLSFKTDWTASGPFTAGPVEIAGKARGSGGVTGTLGAPRLDLIADLDQVDIPRLPLKDARLTLTFQRLADGSSGVIAITAASAYGPAKAHSAFRFPTGGVDLTDLGVDAGGVKAQGSLSLRRNAPSAADLTVDIGRGVLIDAGRIAGGIKIVDATGGARASANLRGENVRLQGSQISVKSARLTADGPLARLPYAALAQGNSPEGAWSLDGKGVLADAQPGYALSFAGGGKLGGRELHTTETAAFRFGGDQQSARLRLAGTDGGRIDLDALMRGGAADVKAKVANLGLGLIDPDLTGRIDASLALQGTGARLDGTLDADLAQARARGSPANQGMDGTLRGRLAGDTIALDVATTNPQGLKANASVVLPAQSSAAPFRVAIARTRPLQGRFAAEGEVRPLWDLLVGGERSLSGFVRTQGTLNGTLAAPHASGQVAVERGRFDDGGSGLSLRDVTLKADFTQEGVNVGEAHGDDGRGGQVSGQGRISLLPEGASSFRLDLKGFRLIDNEQATATASGQATVNRGADGKVKLAGDLTIDRADVAANPPTPSGVVAMEVKEINRPADLPVAFPGAETRGEGWALDVKLKAPRRVMLRGRGLDVELSLDAHVGGTTTYPDLSGTARVVRGAYDLAGKRFDFDTTSVVFLSTHPQNIRLQLDATRDDPTLSVTARIRGTAAKPEITFTSSPSLPNDEVLAQLLFGRSASQLSAVEAAQLASALSSLAGGGGLDVIGNVRSFARLDRLAFGGDQASGVTVSGGKYVTEDVYLELTGGGREGPSAQVEWRIKRNLSILSRIAGQQAGNKLAVRWRRDY